MKTRIGMLIGVGLLVFLTFMGSTAQVQNQRVVWEYKVFENTWDEKALSNVGADGWELVAVDSSRGDRIRAFFKRRK